MVRQQGILMGQIDVELNDIGRQQAAAVAERLSREPKISFVYSSDLKRASETTQIIASSCGGLEIIEDPDLRERHVGELQGLIYREAAKIRSKAFQALESHRTDQEIPGGGESLYQLYQHCTYSLQRIGRKHKGVRVVVVNHGGVITELHLYDGNEWCIKSWGDVSHLNELKSGFGGDTSSG